MSLNSQERNGATSNNNHAWHHSALQPSCWESDCQHRLKSTESWGRAWWKRMEDQDSFGELCTNVFWIIYIISFDVKNARKTLTLYPASSSYHYQTTGSRSVKVSQPPYQTYPGSAQTSPNLASKWHWALKMQLPGDSSLSNSCGFRDVAKHNIINIVNGSKAHPITPLRLFHDNNTSKWFYDASN